jgi:hypothetical protein
MKRKTLYRSIHKEISGIQREIKKEQGFFDGRFVTRAVKSKKDFSRKIKHKNNNN